MSQIRAGLELARLDEIANPGALVVAAEGVSLILTRCDGAVSAFVNRCAHADYRLERADGRLIVQEGRFLVCAAHGASYALKDGACAGGPCNGRGLERLKIMVRDGRVFSA